MRPQEAPCLCAPPPFHTLNPKPPPDGSHFAEDFEDAEGYGWSIPGKPEHDWAKLIANKNKELLRLTGIYGNLLKVQAGA